MTQQDRIGVLLTNLGTPAAPTTKAVRRYLAEFLWDPRVVEIPRPLWWLILYGLVLPLRPRKSAKAYQKIWREDGSPLLTITYSQAESLQDKLSQQDQHEIIVQAAMRYGAPSIKDGLQNLRSQGAKKILVLPLYPQYAGATTGSTFDAISKVLRKQRWIPEIRMINQYADNQGYIDAVAQSIKAYWQRHGQGDQLIFSFHGLPQRNVDAGDPYYAFCHKTADLVAAALTLEPNQWQLTFQSRFGKAQWLQPYTDKTLEQLGQDGVSRVDVVCPGFAADCLETLEEIDMQNREIFLNAGGKEFHYIPALNDSETHIQALTNLVNQHVSGWK